MVTFVDAHRDVYGVEPIRRELPIAPSTYFWHKAQHAGSPRAGVVGRYGMMICARRFSVCGTRIFRCMARARCGGSPRREGIVVARCTVQRLMQAMGLAGAVRGRAWVTTTQLLTTAVRPPDLVERAFAAQRPNQLWVSDFTYVATWHGFVYVAFVIEDVRAADRGVAGVGVLAAHRLRAGCARAGDL